jgi:hypothetical protein
MEYNHRHAHWHIGIFCAHRGVLLLGATGRTPEDKMADGVDIDLYADDIEQDFAQVLRLPIIFHYVCKYVEVP